MDTEAAISLSWEVSSATIVTVDGKSCVPLGSTLRETRVGRDGRLAAHWPG